MTGRTQLQRVMLLPGATGGDGAGRPAVPRSALVLTAPDAAARARAVSLGRPVVVSQELAEGRPGESSAERAHRLDTLVRSHAVSDRWRDLVVVADPDTLRDVATGLCSLPDATMWSGAAEVVTVGLPRGTRPVRVLPTLVGALVVALLALPLLGRFHPLLLPGLVAVGGVALLPWAVTRHAARTLLAVAGLATLVVFLGVAGAGRFPVE